MNVDALSVYVSTCRLALQTTASPDDIREDQAIGPTNVTEQTSNSHANNNNNNNNNNNIGGLNHAWTELYRLLPCLRQSLTCPLCGQIPSDPVSSPLTYNCRQCYIKSGPTAARCATGDPQAKILVQCYRKLCQYLESTDFYRKLGSLSANGGSRSLAELIREGASLTPHLSPADANNGPPKVNYRPTSSLLSRLLAQPSLPGGNTVCTMNSRTTANALSRVVPHPGGDSGSNGLPLTSSNLYSVSLTDMHSTRITIKREQGSKVSPEDDSAACSSSSSSTSTTSSSSGSELGAITANMISRRGVKDRGKPGACVRGRGARRGMGRRPGRGNGPAANNTTGRKLGCHCGNAARVAGKLTCRGQRCPCYSDGVACFGQCKCSGCKNPHRRRSTLKSTSSSSSLSTSSSSSSSSSSDNLPLHPTRNSTNKTRLTKSVGDGHVG